MNNTVISKERYMNYESHFKQPMQTDEMTPNMINSKNSHLINALDRSNNHPLIRRNGNIPFN